MKLLLEKSAKAESKDNHSDQRRVTSESFCPHQLNMIVSQACVYIIEKSLEVASVATFVILIGGRLAADLLAVF